MKKLGTLILATLILSSAHANTTRIGNGGDTQTDRQLSAEELRSAIIDTNCDIQLLIHAWLNNESLQKPVLSKTEKANLLAVVRATPVDILGQDSCHDGITDKDAVAYTQPANKICVSIPQLQNKLTSGNYKGQILALLVHEYSHLIGFDEQRAEQLQSDTLLYISFMGYPVAYAGGEVDDFTLLDPYSRFKGLWKSKIRLAEELSIYVRELIEKIDVYTPYSMSNYPALPRPMNYTGDITIRLNYLNLVKQAYWQKPTNHDVRARLENFLAYDSEVNLTFFNNSELNPSLQNIVRNDLTVPVINKTSPEADFRTIILQIDALKRQMEVYLLSVLRPTAKFTYYPSGSGN